MEKYQAVMAEAEKIVAEWKEDQIKEFEAQGLEFGKTKFKNTKGEIIQLLNKEETIQAIKVEHPFHFNFELRGYRLNKEGKVSASIRKINFEDWKQI